MNIDTFYKSYLDNATPYKHQTQLWEIIEKGTYPILLKVPKGSGKTEAVIAPFLSQFVGSK